MFQLRAGMRLYGHGQRVAHAVELPDEAYALQADALTSAYRSIKIDV